jgi:mono/diheme cytochrome c family protein
MFYSRAYETYAPNGNFSDNTGMRKPVEGTVSRDFDVFPYTIDEQDRLRAGDELKNPYEITDAILEKGKTAYGRYCLMCHGEKGNGEGHLYTSGRYIVKPRTLVGEAGGKLKDGEIYHSITLGFGSMGAHGAQIRPDERWAIVSYVRNVLQPSEMNQPVIPQ